MVPYNHIDGCNISHLVKKKELVTATESLWDVSVGAVSV